MSEWRIPRFNRTQRALHWSHSITFILLLATGSILWVRQLGELVGHHLQVLTIHEYISIFYISGPLVWLLLGNRRSLVRDFKEFDEWDQDDVRWLKRSIAKGPAATDLPPQGRFNAGQKLNGILTIAATLGFIATGVIIWRPQWFHSDSLSNNAVFLHEILTLLSIPLVLGHIYLAALARATRPALRTILDGTVPISYARAHHAKWAAQFEVEGADTSAAEQDAAPRMPAGAS